MKAKFQRLAKMFGLLFLVTGIALPSMEIFDAATATPTTASIVKLGQTCEKRTCEFGNCRWRRFKCVKEAALIAEGTKVRRKKHAKLAFGNGTEPKTAWASYSKLKLRANAKIGDRVPILYRGPAPYYVALYPSFSHVGTGIKATLFGLFLLYAAGQFGRSGQSGQPGKTGQPGKSGSNPQPHRQTHRQAPSPSATPENTPATSVAERPPLIPNPFSSRPDRAPSYTSKPRQNVVQRNTSWF